MKKTTITWGVNFDEKTKRLSFNADVCNDDKIGQYLLLSFVSMCNIFEREGK